MGDLRMLRRGGRTMMSSKTQRKTGKLVVPCDKATLGRATSLVETTTSGTGCWLLPSRKTALLLGHVLGRSDLRQVSTEVSLPVAHEARREEGC